MAARGYRSGGAVEDKLDGVLGGPGVPGDVRSAVALLAAVLECEGRGSRATLSEVRLVRLGAFMWGLQASTAAGRSAMNSLIFCSVRESDRMESAWTLSPLRCEVTMPSVGDVYLGMPSMRWSIEARTSHLVSVVLRHNVHRGMPSTAWMELTAMIPSAVGGAPCVLRGDGLVTQWAVTLPRDRLIEALGALYAKTAVSHIAVMDSKGLMVNVDWAAVCRACSKQHVPTRPVVQGRPRDVGHGSSVERGLVSDSSASSRERAKPRPMRRLITAQEAVARAVAAMTAEERAEIARGPSVLAAMKEAKHRRSELQLQRAFEGARRVTPRRAAAPTASALRFVYGSPRVPAWNVTRPEPVNVEEVVAAAPRVSFENSDGEEERGALSTSSSLVTSLSTSRKSAGAAPVVLMKTTTRSAARSVGSAGGAAAAAAAPIRVGKLKLASKRGGAAATTVTPTVMPTVEEVNDEEEMGGSGGDDEKEYAARQMLTRPDLLLARSPCNDSDDDDGPRSRSDSELVLPSMTMTEMWGLVGPSKATAVKTRKRNVARSQSTEASQTSEVDGGLATSQAAMRVTRSRSRSTTPVVLSQPLAPREGGEAEAAESQSGLVVVEKGASSDVAETSPRVQRQD